MKVKTTSLLAFLMALALLILSACSNRETPNSTITPSSQSEPTSPPSSSSLSSESPSEAPQEESSVTSNLSKDAVESAFTVPIIGDMGINYGEINFTIRLPKSWAVTDMGIFEDEEKVAELPNARPDDVYLNADGEVLSDFSEMDFSLGGEDCVASWDFIVGEYAGKYYHRQYENDGLHTDVTYCIDTGDIMIIIQFYPVEETAVETQIEQFTTLATTIEILKA